MIHLLVVSLIAEFCNGATILKLQHLSKEVSRAFKTLPFVECFVGRWARHNRAVLADLRTYHVSLWNLLIATFTGGAETIEHQNTLISEDGRRYLLRVSVSDVLNFITTSTINIPVSLGYGGCDVIKLYTSMHGNDLGLRVFLFPVKHPDLQLKIKLYAASEETDPSEGQAVEASGLSNWPVSPTRRDRDGVPAGVETQDPSTLDASLLGVQPGVHVTAQIPKGPKENGVFIWRNFVPEFKRSHMHFTNGDGKCYIELQID
eukprot:Gregarina_sp_Pseudo_9__1616@NODE_208_length_3611_cov_31_945969_g193_i0_p3_GENE_NODE_208_length_3611_cov_31_945969_g193_i0NODE_208_length_3611_cov_31_945969_g193_i0_p3_ORF_typecomplete_len261_score31_36_NODE_208_length_3611_cov_31_945969_g193_i030812